MNKLMTIGTLANEAGVNVETIRFYERKGILAQPQKQGGFRYYPSEYVTRIRFIKRSQELGFTLVEVTELLDLKIKDQAKCSDVLSKTKLKIAEIEKKILDLTQMKKSLTGLAGCCEDSDQPLSDCPILDCFMLQKEM